MEPVAEWELHFSFYDAVSFCYKTAMRKLLWSILGLWLCGLLSAGADTLQLTDGTTVTGDPISYTDNGVILREADDSYTDRLPWLKFSQASLKLLAQNPKIAPFVLPFIEPPPPAATQKPQINVSEPARLAYFASASLLAGLFASPVTLVILLLIYAANLFAAYEVAMFRNKPLGAVIGTSAVLPVIGPAIFLSMAAPPVQEEAPVEEAAAPAAPGAPGVPPPAAPEPHHFIVPHTAAPPPPQPGTAPTAAQEEIHIVAGGFSGEPPPPPQTKTEIFQRGQFMFNRRFFETKFSGFFGIIRAEADRGKVLMVKIPTTLLTVERISRISANEVHFEVLQGGQRQEVAVPFADIQQIQLKHQA